mmetsp:Transcript_98477/g.205371  ORF Transcript_98477/g.205371 Transcript_98477/m.205371 type:complete len:205 (-) Transcript_98477:509-1123(-)
MSLKGSRGDSGPVATNWCVRAPVRDRARALEHQQHRDDQGEAPSGVERQTEVDQWFHDNKDHDELGHAGSKVAPARGGCADSSHDGGREHLPTPELHDRNGTSGKPEEGAGSKQTPFVPNPHLEVQAKGGDDQDASKCLYGPEVFEDVPQDQCSQSATEDGQRPCEKQHPPAMCLRCTNALRKDLGIVLLRAITNIAFGDNHRR